MPKKPDPRDFPDMPSTRHLKTRGHPVDALADEIEGLSIQSGTPDKPDVSGTPDMRDTPGKSGKSDKPDVPEAAQHKPTRTTRNTGEEVKRATFWLTNSDLETLVALQRAVDIPDARGVPDKSSIVREAIRRWADEVLSARDQS